MTPRNLFNVILKTLGVFFIKDILLTVPQLLSTIFYLTKSETQEDAIWTLIFTALILAVFIWISYLLIFRSIWIIDTLQLDRGFDQEVLNFNVSLSSALTIALIVAGAYILTTEMPTFCRQLFSYFQERQMTTDMTKPEISYSVFTAVKIILALLIIGERKRIVEFILSNQTAPGEEVIDEV